MKPSVNAICFHPTSLSSSALSVRHSITAQPDGNQRHESGVAMRLCCVPGPLPGPPAEHLATLPLPTSICRRTVRNAQCRPANPWCCMSFWRLKISHSDVLAFRVLGVSFRPCDDQVAQEPQDFVRTTYRHDRERLYVIFFRERPPPWLSSKTSVSSGMPPWRSRTVLIVWRFGGVCRPKSLRWHQAACNMWSRRSRSPPIQSRVPFGVLGERLVAIFPCEMLLDKVG